jgi:hypothetical protein
MASGPADVGMVGDMDPNDRGRVRCDRKDASDGTLPWYASGATALRHQFAD